MKLTLPLLPAIVIVFALAAAATVRAAESSASHAYVVQESDVVAVMAADEERVLASMAKDRARLDAVLSDELRYAHSNGHIDTKSSYVDSIAEGRSVYESYDYQHQSFKAIAPGVVLMTGRALIGSRNAEGPVTIDLNFLAVWRNENGVWRFLAWQSCRNPPPAPPPSPPPPAAN